MINPINSSCATRLSSTCLKQIANCSLLETSVLYIHLPSKKNVFGPCMAPSAKEQMQVYSGKYICHVFSANGAYGKVSEKRNLACIIKKHNKNALRLKCYNFRRVNAIVFLFSALHTTPFLYGKIHFGILNMLHASIAMSDTPRGSNPP